MRQGLYSSEVPRGWLPWGALAPVLAFVFVVASALAGSLLIEPYVSLDGRGNPLGTDALMAFLLAPFGILLLVVLAWVKFVERRSLAAVGWTGERKMRAFLRGHLIGVASLLGIVAAIWMVGGFSATSFAEAWKSPPALLSIAGLLACFALQASVEELVFRGWLLSVLSTKFNVAIGVVLSSMLFGLLHFSRGQPWLVTVSNGLFGVFACCWALRSRSVLGVMGWHAGWNWLLAVGFTLPVTGLDAGVPALLVDLDPSGPNWLTGGPQGPEGSVVTVVYFSVAIAWLLRGNRVRVT